MRNFIKEYSKRLLSWHQPQVESARPQESLRDTVDVLTPIRDRCARLIQAINRAEHSQLRPPVTSTPLNHPPLQPMPLLEDFEALIIELEVTSADAELAAKATDVLAKMIDSPEGKALLVAQKGNLTPCLLRLIRQCAAEPAVVEHCWHILAQLNVPDEVPTLPGNDYLRALFNTWDTHSGNGNILAHLLETLCSILDTEYSESERLTLLTDIIARGCIKRALATASRFESHQTLLVDCLRVIEGIVRHADILPIDHDIARELRADIALPIVQKALVAFADNTELVVCPCIITRFLINSGAPSAGHKSHLCEALLNNNIPTLLRRCYLAQLRNDHPHNVDILRELLILMTERIPQLLEIEADRYLASLTQLRIYQRDQIDAIVPKRDFECAITLVMPVIPVRTQGCPQVFDYFELVKSIFQTLRHPTTNQPIADLAEIVPALDVCEYYESNGAK